MSSQFWQRLRHARKGAGLTQLDVAKQCGVSRAAVALWESVEPDHRTTPTAENCIKIAHACKVSIAWLLNDASDLEDPARFALEAPVVENPTDVLPDLRQGGQVFLFAQTPEQIGRKLKQLGAEAPGTAHLILVGTDASIQTVSTPTDALAAVIKHLTGSDRQS